MGSFIARQPNGKYCRFSSVVDTVTHINMDYENYVKLIMSRGYCREYAENEAKDVFDNYLQDFDVVLKDFRPINNTKEEFNKLVEKMKDPNGEYEEV